MQQINTIMLGFVAVTQPLYLVEKALDNILDEAVPILREHVVRLDDIVRQIDDSRLRMKASQLGNLTLQQDEVNMLWRERRRWAVSMADLLACPINAYSELFMGGNMGTTPISTPVIHS